MLFNYWVNDKGVRFAYTFWLAISAETPRTMLRSIGDKAGGVHMLILLTYDISISTPNGQQRLTKVSKLCERYGNRVQKSVYELFIDQRQLDTLKQTLLSIINPATDSIRLYRLGNNYLPRILVLGHHETLTTNGVMAV